MTTMKNTIEGIKILMKYSGEDSHDIYAEHDKIYAGPDVNNISDKDKEKLEKFGWFFKEDEESWMIFV